MEKPTHEPDPCPIHTSDQALDWFISSGCTMHTYKTIFRVTHRASRKSVVHKAGINGFSTPGSFMMACRKLWFLANKQVIR